MFGCFSFRSHRYLPYHKPQTGAVSATCAFVTSIYTCLHSLQHHLQHGQSIARAWKKGNCTKISFGTSFITRNASATHSLYATTRPYDKPARPWRTAYNALHHLSQKVCNHSELSAMFGGQFMHLSYSSTVTMTFLLWNFLYFEAYDVYATCQQPFQVLDRWMTQRSQQHYEQG